VRGCELRQRLSRATFQEGEDAELRKLAEGNILPMRARARRLPEHRQRSRDLRKGARRKGLPWMPTFGKANVLSIPVRVAASL